MTLHDLSLAPAGSHPDGRWPEGPFEYLAAA